MAQLLSNLPVGAKIKFGKYSVNGETAEVVKWVVVARNHSGYSANSVTLITEGVIDLRCFDAAEPTSPDTSSKSNGLARYKLSNIRQWLNSKVASGWYSSQHTYDQAPSADYTTDGTAYVNRPGFLNAFRDNEISAIISTPIVYYDHQDGLVTLSDKVFLPSYREITGENSGNFNLEGTQWEYFQNHTTLVPLTSQAFVNSNATQKLHPDKGKWLWLTRSANESGSKQRVMHNVAPSDYIEYAPNIGYTGVRPAVTLSGTRFISDTTDSSGYYTVMDNSAPNMPTTLNLPTIYGGKANTISWSAATDPDGDSLTYQLECSVNGGAYTQIYSGTATSYPHLVTFGTLTVSYRVRATDPSGESSAYFTSSLATVINNYAPVISGTDSNLGVKDKGFTGSYTVTDSNNNKVTVTEAIDGVQIRSLVATLGSAINYSITDNTWLALSNGSHTLTIRATDGIDTTVRTYTFTKLVDSFTIQTSNPWDSTAKPSRIMLVVTRNLPSGATFKVEVCNNGYDVYPTWEDATDAVRSGLVHVFANNANVAGKWGVKIRVTVARNGATGACYVSAIGGNFE